MYLIFCIRAFIYVLWLQLSMFSPAVNMANISNIILVPNMLHWLIKLAGGELVRCKHLVSSRVHPCVRVTQQHTQHCWEQTVNYSLLYRHNKFAVSNCTEVLQLSIIWMSRHFEFGVTNTHYYFAKLLTKIREVNKWLCYGSKAKRTKDLKILFVVPLYLKCIRDL